MTVWSIAERSRAVQLEINDDVCVLVLELGRGLGWRRRAGLYTAINPEFRPARGECVRQRDLAGDPSVRSGNVRRKSAVTGSQQRQCADHQGRESREHATERSI